MSVFYSVSSLDSVWLIRLWLAKSWLFLYLNNYFFPPVLGQPDHPLMKTCNYSKREEVGRRYLCDETIWGANAALGASARNICGFGCGMAWQHTAGSGMYAITENNRHSSVFWSWRLQRFHSGDAGPNVSPDTLQMSNQATSFKSVTGLMKPRADIAGVQTTYASHYF